MGLLDSVLGAFGVGHTSAYGQRSRYVTRWPLWHGLAVGPGVADRSRAPSTVACSSSVPWDCWRWRLARTV